jgi:hypothetical protein
MEQDKHHVKMQTLAMEIYSWCKKRDLWGDNIIYFNGKAWKSDNDWSGVQGKEIAEDLYEFEDRNPCTYFEYGNPDTLSMSFEGSLYEALNGYWYYSKAEEDLQAIFEKYGYYFEYGNAWNLSAYEL